jgi:hypothetical protein
MVSVTLSRMLVAGELLILFAPVSQSSPTRSPEAIADDSLKNRIRKTITKVEELTQRKSDAPPETFGRVVWVHFVCAHGYAAKSMAVPHCPSSTN